MLNFYKYPGDDIPIIKGSALCALEGHDDKIGKDRVLELMDMTHAKTCRILKQLGRAWPRPADEPALNAHSSTYRCLRIPR